MTDDEIPNVTPLFKPLKKPPVSISWGPNYEQMETLGINSTYINAFRVQTLQLESIKDERDLIRHAYADLSDQAQMLAQQGELAAAEIDRLARQLAAEQALTQKLAMQLELARSELQFALESK
jgi:hypothetical protein